MRNTETGQFLPAERIGERHGRFVVIRDTGKINGHGSKIWLCKCDCGNEFELGSDKMSRRLTCGCGEHSNSGQQKPVQIEGTICRSILARKATGEKTAAGYLIYECECLICGSVFEKPSYNFTRKDVTCKCSGWIAQYRVGKKPLPDYKGQWNSYYHGYLGSANARNLVFDLNKQDFRKLVTQDCFYCGAKPVEKKISKNCHGTISVNGIDRIDNSVGYTVENCVPCCPECNFAKGQMDQKDFLALVDRIYRHRHEK